MARILIVGGGCRGRQLASSLIGEGHAVRITTRGEEGREAIEATGAECWIGTPDRLATLRGALESTTIACWLLGSAVGPRQRLRELHTSRLQLFVTQAVDTTVRGFVYEEAGTSTPEEILREGGEVVRAVGERNAIPLAFIRANPAETGVWLAETLAAIAGLLGRSR
ncbi:MAG TPA: hypothetical protein VG010_05185 [Solirubrobacteraceae bacterium]|nr:hypothetical protein [Solirubrobacteraceae bacterium]